MRESETYEAMADYIERHGHHRGELFDPDPESTATCVMGAYLCSVHFRLPFEDRGMFTFANKLVERLGLSKPAGTVKHTVAWWSDNTPTQQVLDGLRKAAKLARIDEEAAASA